MLQGDQVTLRPMSADDLEPLVDLFAEPEVARWWPGENLPRLQARLTDAEEGVGLVIEVEEDLIGFVQFFEETDPDYRHASIDIVLHPNWTDRGLGTDAVRTLARHLFEDRGHHRLTIDPTVSNLRAIASYRKVGFRDVGVMRRYERANDGTWRDSLLMDLLVEELASSQPSWQERPSS